MTRYASFNHRCTDILLSQNMSITVIVNCECSAWWGLLYWTVHNLFQRTDRALLNRWLTNLVSSQKYSNSNAAAFTKSVQFRTTQYNRPTTCYSTSGQWMCPRQVGAFWQIGACTLIALRLNISCNTERTNNFQYPQWIPGHPTWILGTLLTRRT